MKHLFTHMETITYQWRLLWLTNLDKDIVA